MIDVWSPHKHRTASDGITFEGEATGLGGGGTGGVQVVTVPVSSAEILDLFNTPVVLIPGVAGKVTVVNSTAFVYLAGLVPYLDNGGSITVGCAGAAQNWAGTTGAGFWDQATSQLNAQPYGTAVADALAAYPGANIDLFVLGGANPTLGDGTLLVTLSYFLAPTV